MFGSSRAGGGAGPLLQRVPLSARVASWFARQRKRLRTHMPVQLTMMHYFIMAVSALAMIGSLYVMSGLVMGGGSGNSVRLAASSHTAALARIRRQLAADAKVYDPITSVAFAIPVGGRTERSAQLKSIVQNLVDGGAPRDHIFVFEDVLSRPDGLPSPRLRDAVDELNAQARAQMVDEGRLADEAPLIRLIGSNVSRAEKVTSATFGIHLARHYKFMLDYIFIGDTAPQVAAREALGAKQEAGTDRSSTPPAVGVTTGLASFSYLTIIEDDLVLAPDTAKYFHEMSRVMRVDSSVYCVAAHQDNAFMATSASREALLPSTLADAERAGVAHVVAHPTLDLLDFPFRRGNHFMAPGWMTSREIYTSVVRDRWLDGQGQYKFKEQLHLRNGHWDRFFDSLVGPDRDCIFSELPRIVHEGADGFTVSKKSQMELYSNLRLSTLPSSVDYGDLSALTKQGYEALIGAFISKAVRLDVAEEWRHYRGAKLVLVARAAQSDKDPQWNNVISDFFGVIGVGGYGGWEGYVKVRGIFRGVVFIRWGTNNVLVVGGYSPFLAQVDAMRAVVPAAPIVRPGAQENIVREAREVAQAIAEAVAVADLTTRWPAAVLQREGCFAAAFMQHHVIHYTRATVSPRSCTLSCLHLGYAYAGVVQGAQCHCLSELPPLEQMKPPSACHSSCLGLATQSQFQSTYNQLRSNILGAKEPCGGFNSASVYSAATQHSLVSRGVPAAPSAEAFLAEPKDAMFVAGGEGQSCTDACEQAGGECSEPLFPLLHRSCAALQRVMGCSGKCREEPDIERGFATPGHNTKTNQCTMARGKYIMCTRKPQAGYLRACVCKKPKSQQIAAPTVGSN